MYSKRILEKFLSQCDNGFIEVGADYCIENVNETVLELSGFSAPDLRGASLETIFDGITANKICTIYNSFGCREINHKIPGELLNRTEKPRAVEISVNCSGEAGDVIYWLLIKNKSFRKEMENRLKQSELMLKTTLESLPFDFWINDAENRTYMQNSHSKALWGDVKGKTPGEVTLDSMIVENWLDTTARALSGEIINDEISYVINGRRKYFRNILAPIRDEEHMFGILGMNIDITDLKEAVETRDMLLKEVHHRVKNNLQMIISIIRLEESESCYDEDSHNVYSDIIHRIEAVSMIHERLYKAEVNNSIRISDYLRGLVEQIASGSGIRDLELVFDLDEPDIEPKRTILLGLIINEIVTNSLKYAFGRKEDHRLGVKLKNQGDSVYVGISDNGPGLPDDFKAEDCSSLGFLMMNTFIQQLGGRLEWDSSSEGCTFRFNIPVKKAET